jgi:glycerol-3-phosphate dehydrogenase
MAQTLQDVVLRRTDLGTAGHPGRKALKLAARHVADELGWEPERVEAEVSGVEGFYYRHGAQRMFGSSPLRQSQESGAATQ